MSQREFFIERRGVESGAFDRDRRVASGPVRLSTTRARQSARELVWILAGEQSPG